MNQTCFLGAISSKETLVAFSKVLSVDHYLMLSTHSAASSQDFLWVYVTYPDSLSDIDNAIFVIYKLHSVVT